MMDVHSRAAELQAAGKVRRDALRTAISELEAEQRARLEAQRAAAGGMTVTAAGSGPPETDPPAAAASQRLGVKRRPADSSESGPVQRQRRVLLDEYASSESSAEIDAHEDFLLEQAQHDFSE